MPRQTHNTEQLKAYRKAAVELRELSRGVEDQLNMAEESGRIQDAKTALAELQVRTEEFKKLRDELGPSDIFLAKYNIVVHDEHTVSFVLPKGRSRLEMLEEARILVRNRTLISPEQLSWWSTDREFTKEAPHSERMYICGHVKESAKMSRIEQENLVGEKKFALLEDLTIAFAAHWIATEEPLFGWFNRGRSTYLIRAAGGVLGFNSDGLGMRSVNDDERYGDVAAASTSAPVLLRPDKTS